MKDWAELVAAVSGLLGAVAWPAVVIFLAVRYSASFKTAALALVDRIRGDDELDVVAKIGGQEFQAKFTRIASSSIAILASTSDAAIGSSPRELLALEASVSSSVPLGTRAQVAAAHTLVLDRLTELVEDNHLSIPDWGRDLRTITTTLSSATVISVAEGRALADFGQLTDLVESVDDSELTDPLVREYVALASALLRALERPQGEG